MFTHHLTIQNYGNYFDWICSDGLFNEIPITSIHSMINVYVIFTSLLHSICFPKHVVSVLYYPFIDGGKNPMKKRGTLPIPFHKSQLDSRMFGVVGLTGLWTHYHSKLFVFFSLKLKNKIIFQPRESIYSSQNTLILSILIYLMRAYIKLQPQA